MMAVEVNTKSQQAHLAVLALRVAVAQLDRAPFS